MHRRVKSTYAASTNIHQDVLDPSAAARGVSVTSSKLASHRIRTQSLHILPRIELCERKDVKNSGVEVHHFGRGRNFVA